MEILDIFKFVDAALNKAKINKFWKNHFCTPYITYTLPFSKMGYRKSTFTPQPLSIFTPLSTHKEPPCTRASTIATVRAPSSTNLHQFASSNTVGSHHYLSNNIVLHQILVVNASTHTKSEQQDIFAPTPRSNSHDSTCTSFESTIFASKNSMHLRSTSNLVSNHHASVPRQSTELGHRTVNHGNAAALTHSSIVETLILERESALCHVLASDRVVNWSTGQLVKQQSTLVEFWSIL